MSSSVAWWQQGSPSFFNDTLSFINESRCRDRAVDRCGDLSKALNKVWAEYYRYRHQRNKLNDTEKKNGCSDSQSLRELLLNGIGGEQAMQLCRADCIRRLAEFTPHILNHATLVRCDYDPTGITEDLRLAASDEHRQFQRALGRFAEAPEDLSRRVALLKKTAQLVYVVRCNIFHSEKTSRGPDLNKSERDRSVSEVVADVVERIFDVLFDSPQHRLAIYASPAPEDSSVIQLKDLNGRWEDAEVDGQIADRDGKALFFWTLPGDRIPVKILCSAELSQYFDQNDRINRSRRILVPCHVAGRISVCNIYAAH